MELFGRWVRDYRQLTDVKDELDKVEPIADQYYQIGRRFFDRGNLDEAIDNFQNALKINRGHFRARLYLGETFLELGQVVEARKELKQAYDLDKSESRDAFTRALVAQAKFYEGEGNDELALDWCRKALSVSPSNNLAQDTKNSLLARKAHNLEKADALNEAISVFDEMGDTQQIDRLKKILEERQKLEPLEIKAKGYMNSSEWDKSNWQL